MYELTYAVVALALVFDFVNGFHDAANAIATIVATRVLNPVQAEVEIALSVNAIDSSSEDELAKGALTYATIAKEAQAIANLANTAEQIVELIPL